MKRPTTIDDLLALKWVSDPHVSPDGTRVVFTQKVADRDADTYRAHLWMLPLDGGPARQFTAGEHQDTLPRWSPDGRWIAFLSDRGAAGNEGAKKPKQIYLIPADGGEARQLTAAHYNPSDLAWAPDGRTLAFVGKPESPKPESDVTVIARARYKFDGEGFWDGRYKHIFTISLEGGDVRQLTAGDFDQIDPAWSPDGRWLAFVSNRSEEADFTNVTDIWVIAAAGGEPRRLTESVGPCSMPAWSPDGKSIAYLGHDNAAMGATNLGLWIVPAQGGAPPRVLTKAFDRSLIHHILTDMRTHPKAGTPVWFPDGRRVLVLVAEGATNQLAVVDVASGEVQMLTSGRRELYGYAFDRAVQVGTALISDPLTPGDLWLLRLEESGSTEQRLTTVNQALLDGIELSIPERFTYDGADGWPVEGWVMRPIGFREGTRYPTVLQIHGGPHAAYGEAFFHEFQLLASEGFAIVYTNPRGSQGYGQRFTAATHHDWGGKDYEDIMRGLDAALARYAFLDPDRLGVAGGSYGGFMTNWVIGHTDRFKAAVTMRSISNHLSQWGMSDLAFMKGFWEFPGDPWESPTWYWERSPLAYVTNIKTPLLILHSEMDLRCPMGEAEQLFAALKKLRREVVFLRFPNESHDLSRIGKPAHRTERLRWIVKWFTDHLRQPMPIREAVAAGGGTE